MKNATFEKWNNVLDNIESVTPGDWFVYGQQLTRDIESYETQKRETRRIYNNAVEEYNKLLDLSEKINKALFGDAPDDNENGNGEVE